MIVNMNKVALLCLAADRENTLKALRRLGVLHLEPVREPESAGLEEAAAALEQAAVALRVLRARKTEETARSDLPHPGAAECIADTIRVHERRRRLGERLDALKAELAAVEPFGEFDPDAVDRLEQQGIAVKLYISTAKTLPPPPEGATLLVTHENSGIRHLALVGRGELDYPERELPLPERAISVVRTDMAAVEDELRELDRRLAELTACAPEIERETQRLESVVRFEEARASMGESGRIAYLRGFCPVDRVEALRKAAAEHGWGLIVELPDPEDRVPTLIRNPSWIRPIQSLFDFIKITPGYREVDVSASFLFFLSIFFAMIVGDAGYGLVYLGLTLFARAKLKRAPAEPFVLMSIFSVATIVWGVLTGTYFGALELPAPLEFLRVDWLQEQNNLIELSLLIGAIHLTLAHLWNAIRLGRSLQALAQLGWIGVAWTMFLSARYLLLPGAPLPGWMWPMLVVSLLAILLFMTPFRTLKKDWANHIMLPLSIVSCFGDVLSYLRLFGLGIASLELARAFNTMATNIGFGGPVSGFGAALVLFVGHSLNVVLCSLSVLVHGIRLNALEFSMHLGLEWSGFEYKPFAERSLENK